MGTLKPNDLGLFDVHGNVWTWCQERYDRSYPKRPGDEAADDDEDKELVIDRTVSRVLRGGSLNLRPSFVRSAFRDYNQQVNRGSNNGFRLARTFTP